MDCATSSPEFRALYAKFQATGSLNAPPVIVEALLNKKNCSILGRVDRIILSFIASSESSYTYTSRNNYERLICHQLGCWYELKTESPHKACVEVLLHKPHGFILARTPISELIECVHEFQRNAERARALALRQDRELNLKGFLPAAPAPAPAPAVTLAQEELLINQLSMMSFNPAAAASSALLQAMAPGPLAGALGGYLPAGLGGFSPLSLPSYAFLQPAPLSAPLPMQMNAANPFFAAQQAQLERVLRRIF